MSRKRKPFKAKEMWTVYAEYSSYLSRVFNTRDEARAYRKVCTDWPDTNWLIIPVSVREITKKRKKPSGTEGR